MNYLKWQLLGGAGMVVLAGIAMAVSSADRAMNYAEVNARVAEVVSEDCWIQLGNETWTEQNGEEASCRKVGELVKLDPQGKAEIKGKRQLKVSYVSPVDNAEHSAVLTLTDSQPGFETVETYDELAILAHTSDPAKITYK